jgi:hypothetical protein
LRQHKEHSVFNTVLSFTDFFWIWWIVVLIGGPAYLRAHSQTKDAIESLERQISTLTEEIRNLKAGNRGAG